MHEAITDENPRRLVEVKGGASQAPEERNEKEGAEETPCQGADLASSLHELFGPDHETPRLHPDRQAEPGVGRNPAGGDGLPGRDLVEVLLAGTGEDDHGHPYLVRSGNAVDGNSDLHRMIRMECQAARISFLRGKEHLAAAGAGDADYPEGGVE